MKKDELKIIKQIAYGLPVELRLEKHTTKFNGKGLAAEGVEVDPEFDYSYSLPTAVQVNHLGNMKRAMYAEGVGGVYRYSQSVIDRYKAGTIQKRNEEIIQEVAVAAEQFRQKGEKARRRAAWNRTWIGQAIKFIKSIIHKIKKSCQQLRITKKFPG